MAVARPATIALWLLGIPPVSASTRRFSLCCRTEVRVTLATWQIVQATIGASKYFNPAIVRRGRPPWLSGTPGELRPRRGAGRRARGPRRARLAGRYPRPASRWFARGSTGGLRSWAEAECSSHRRGDATQHAVDEASRLVAREGLGELDRFVDGGFGRYAAVDRDLVYGDTKHDAVHLGHLVELPVVGGLAEDGVQFLPVGYDPTHQLAGKGRDVRGRRALTRVIEQHLLGIIIRSLELKQDLERKHSLGRLDHVALDRARHISQLRIGVDGDEHFEVDGSIGFDNHAHASMGGLTADPVTEVARRVLVHARDAFHLAGGQRRNAGDDLIGHPHRTQAAVATHGGDATPSPPKPVPCRSGSGCRPGSDPRSG